ncbi:MAG: hypothetical protein Q9161_006204 [Pseudevernia consocians]
MASILVAATILSYDSIKKSRAKRAEKKAWNHTRFSELERDNAARIAQLQGGSCFCQTSDWTGGGCETHGYVPAAGEAGGPPAPEYTEVDEGGDAGGVRREEEEEATPSGVEDVGTGEGGGYAAPRTTAQGARETYPDYRYRRGQEDGALAGGERGPRGPMTEEEVRRINEERRKRMKAGGFTNWVLRRKGRSGDGDAVVR